MSAAEVLATIISEPLSWDEICARYPDEWVCLVEIDRVHPNGFEFRTARVIGHGKTRRDPFEQARPWREHYKLVGHYYTGCVVAKPLRPVVIIDDETRDAFRIHAELILVEAVVASRRMVVTARLVIDTGAAYTTLTPELVAGLGYGARDGSAEPVSTRRSEARKATC